MTTSDFLSLALSGPHSETLTLEIRRFVKNLYDNLPQIKLADGEGITDMLDFREFCREAMLHLDAVEEKKERKVGV